jgi:hypothetical protein
LPFRVHGKRAEVAHQLVFSLEPADFDEDANQAWAAEVRRRLWAIRDGNVVLRYWDEALTGIRRSLVSRDCRGCGQSTQEKPDCT